MKFREFLYHIRTRALVPNSDVCHGMILMFHRIIEDTCEYKHPQIARLHVTSRHLEQYLTELRSHGYDIISLDELHVRLNSRNKTTKFVVFTFDDAYRDFYERAFPLFQKYNAPFTIYVPTAVPDRHIYWWYFMLDDLVFNNDVIETTITGEKRRFVLDTQERKIQAYTEITTIINGIDNQNRRGVLESLFSPYGLDPDAYADRLSMTWDQLRSLQQSGLATIGGHTVNHFNLLEMSSDDASGEMELGRKRIEAELSGVVDHFSYPFGAAAYREFDLARHLGFKTATTCRHGYLTRGHRSYPERLPRIMVEETTSVSSLVR